MVHYRKYYHCTYLLSIIMLLLKCRSTTYRLDAFFLAKNWVVIQQLGYGILKKINGVFCYELYHINIYLTIH